MQQTIGGSGTDATCVINTVGGYATGNLGGALVGFLGSCVHWGYNKKPVNGWTKV
ncbi:hypothetical protein [Enterococcus sp. AZ163]|uniref:hypothetical protein n=1 Tax=Enterococcus sp. AZ163 TaxID=2774638 RepID=UPI003D265329